MALPTSGVLTMSAVNTELGRAATTAISLNETAVRTLAGVPSGAISMSNLYGKSSVAPPTISFVSEQNYSEYTYLNYSVGGTSPTTSGGFISGGGYITAQKQSNTRYYLYGTRYDRSLTGVYRVTATNSAGSAYVDRSVSLYLSTPSCCFTGDSLVSMADGSRKRIDEVVPGDRVKTPFGESEVDWVRLPTLGARKLLALEGGRCKTSGEHCLWAKDPSTGREFWATRDMQQWSLEAAENFGPGLNGQQPIDLTGLEGTAVSFAKEDGWEETTWSVVEACPSTPLYHLYLKDHASYFVDGFLVIGELPRLESLIDWTQFSWSACEELKPVYMEYDYELPEINRERFVSVMKVEDIGYGFQIPD